MKSIQCLFWAKFLETIDRIAVFGRSLWDLRGTLQEFRLWIANVQRRLPKVKKDRKNDVKTQKSCRRVGSHKTGIESREIKLGRYLSMERNEFGERKLYFLHNHLKIKQGFPLPVTAMEITSLTGLPDTVSMAGYTAERHSGVSVILWRA